MGPETGELLALLTGDEPVPPRYAIEEWLWAAYPDLAERRLEIAEQLEVLLARQDELRDGVSDGATTPSTFDWLSDARIADELADLDTQIETLVSQWQVSPVDIEMFLAPMSVADRDALVALVVVMAATIGELPDEFGPYAETELARLRADYAIAQYMATPGGDAEVGELGETINALDPQSPSVAAAFLDGLFLGDITDTDYQGGAGLANLLGLVVSGELVFGDVRDVIVGLRRDNYGDAAFAAFGFVPFVSALRRVGDAADTARQIRRATRAFRREDAAGTYVRAARVTRAGRKLATEVLNDIGRRGFTRTALDNGINALATVMSKDELTATLLEVRRLEPQRMRMVREIDDLIASGTVPPTMLRQLDRTRNALNKNLAMDDLIGAIRDINGIPVLRVTDGAGSLRIVRHDDEVENALSSMQNTVDKKTQLGELGEAFVEGRLEPLLIEFRAVTGVSP